MKPNPRTNSLETKFPDTYQIVKMLEKMKVIHENKNRCLVLYGHMHLCKNWNEVKISVQDIIDYVHDTEGYKL